MTNSHRNQALRSGVLTLLLALSMMFASMQPAHAGTKKLANGGYISADTSCTSYHWSGNCAQFEAIAYAESYPASHGEYRLNIRVSKGSSGAFFAHTTKTFWGTQAATTWLGPFGDYNPRYPCTCYEDRGPGNYYVYVMLEWNRTNSGGYANNSGWYLSETRTIYSS